MGSGLGICERFYQQIVRPQVDVPHSAALMGRGSEVLGFDDEMSSDHNYEARVLLFVTEEVELRPELPTRFEGRPTQVDVYTLRKYFADQLAFDIDADLTPQDWLTFPESILRQHTAGDVFHDDLGLAAIRERLAYYPDDVWRYLMITAWWRVHPEMNLVGRAGYVGDEQGSALIGAQLVHDLMQLCFLIERTYAPYRKWFGTAFNRLSCGPTLTPLLRQVLRTETWQQREEALMAAYRGVAELHNRLAVTTPIELGVEQMCGRPFKVVWGDFIGKLATDIQDPAVLRIYERWPVGGIEQIRDTLWKPVDRRQALDFL
jgi:hypothetical protein